MLGVDVVVVVIVIVDGVVIECVGEECLVDLSKYWRLQRMCEHVRVLPPPITVRTLVPS